MNTIIYHWKLSQLHRIRARVLVSHIRLQENAKKENKSHDEIESLKYDEMYEVEWIDDEIEALESRKIIESARQLVLPVPEFQKDGDLWERSKITGRYRLSKKAMMELRRLLRKEQKERREGVMLWLAAVTGIIGALSGLLAIWKS